MKQTSSSSLVPGQRLPDRRKVLEERVQQVVHVVEVNHPTLLTDAVHGQHRNADVNRRDSSARRDNRSNGRATRRIILDANLLDRHVLKLGDGLHDGRRRAVRRVALVRVVLDRHALVHLGAVVHLVAVRVVGVHAVHAVHAGHERRADRLLERVRVRREHRRDPAHHVVGERRPGADGRGAAHLLVVVHGQHGDHLVGLDGALVVDVRLETLESVVARHLVVDARGEQELLIETADHGVLRVVQVQVEVDQVLAVDTHLPRNQVKQLLVVALLRRVLVLLRLLLLALLARRVHKLAHDLRAEHGQQMLLLVEGERLTLLRARQVDGKVGDAQDGPRHLDQLRLQAVGRLVHNLARDGNVAVEPRVPEASSVRLHADVLVATALLQRLRLQHKAGAVRVRAHDLEAAASVRLREVSANHKGDERALVPRGEVASVGLELAGPLVVFHQLLEAQRLQLVSTRLHAVEGRRRRVHETNAFLNNLLRRGANLVGETHGSRLDSMKYRYCSFY
eukprot:Rhum_TRINITY_DN20671_c0_g1::Rhum_TRINITY_DN20671_c0_g1_i1::g.171558::m.171558